MDSTQALNTISSVSGPYNHRRMSKIWKDGKQGYLRANNSSGRTPRNTWPLHESPTSSSVEKVILGVDMNRKGVQGKEEELPNVQDQQTNQVEVKIPAEEEYILR
jgi:hypothetical protein